MSSRKFSVTLALALIAALLTAGVVLPATHAGAAPGPTEATAGTGRSTDEFLGLINGLRTSRGVPALAVHGQLASSAQAWSASMAAAGTLSHDPGLAGAASGWTRIAENVGMGPTTAMVWQSFLSSPPHLANLLNPDFTHVGIGFVRSGPALWTTHRFLALGTPATGPGSTPTPPAPPPTSPPPVVTAPPAPVSTTPPLPPPPPPTVPVAPSPVTGLPTAPDPAAGGAGSAGDQSASGGDATGDETGGAGDGSDSVVGAPSAEPDRVADVIVALQALPG